MKLPDLQQEIDACEARLAAIKTRILANIINEYCVRAPAENYRGSCSSFLGLLEFETPSMTFSTSSWGDEPYLNIGLRFECEGLTRIEHCKIFDENPLMIGLTEAERAFLFEYAAQREFSQAIDHGKRTNNDPRHIEFDLSLRRVTCANDVLDTLDETFHKGPPELPLCA